MNIVTQWQEKLSFVGKTTSGHTINIDGESNAISPMEMVLMAIGGCSSIDVVMILKKARQQISNCECEVKAERAETIPQVFTKVKAHYKITGKNLKTAQIQRACQLSMEKYCSVSLMLKNSVEITHSFEIIEEQKLN